MRLTNAQIADAFNHIADSLEEQDENFYRVRAYRRAAISLKKSPHIVADLIANNTDLTIIPYIGSHLAQVIKKMLLTGDLTWMPKPHPPQPYPTHLLLRKPKLPSFKIYSIMPTIEKLLSQLKNLPDIQQIECTGDYRRRKEVVSAVTILFSGKNIQTIFARFHEFASIKYFISTDASHTHVQLKMGIQVTLQAVSQKYFAAKLLELTGSEAHYTCLKETATHKGYQLSDQGLLKNATPLTTSEVDIYQSLDLTFIPPELRENRGEIESAAKNQLPKLVELTDIKGDLHCHTNETDGSFTLEEMVDAAIKHGHQYIAITDHSQSLKITHGMDEKRLLKQIEQIDNLNAKLTNFTILKSMEVDILADGSLDLSNDVLKQLDLTVCSVHSKFRLPLEQQTERILRAMDNPYFTILGHATGRLINHRPPYQIDLERILQAAKDRHCFIEVNAQPARLDINDLYCKKAKEIGVKVAISSDAHTTKGFQFMILGVNQARRGWLEAKDVINTYELKQLKQLLKR